MEEEDSFLDSSNLPFLEIRSRDILVFGRTTQTVELFPCRFAQEVGVIKAVANEWAPSQSAFILYNEKYLILLLL